MATTTRTFDFTTDADGWTGTPMSADSTVARFDDAGDQCFRHRISGRNKGPDGNYAEVSNTWATLFSIAASATVTGIRVASFNWRCSEFNVVTESRYSDATGVLTNAFQYLGDSNIELHSGLNVTGTTSWAPINGAPGFQSVPAADQAGSTTVAFRANTFQENANNAAAVSALLWDDLILEIEYTDVTVRIPRSASMVPMLGG